MKMIMTKMIPFAVVVVAAALLLSSLVVAADNNVASQDESFTFGSLLAPDNDPKKPRILIEYNNLKFIRMATEYAIDGQIRDFIQITEKRNSNNNNNSNNSNSSSSTSTNTNDQQTTQSFEIGAFRNKLLSIVVNSTDMIDRIMENEYVDRVEIDQKMEPLVYSKHPRYVNLKSNNDHQNSNMLDDDELEFINKISTLRQQQPVKGRKLKLFGNDDKGEVIPYGITMVQAHELWPLRQANKFVEVCVVDTGYNAGHEDLPTVAEKQVGGTNTGAGVWFNDGHGHGTHCSGTIGAVGNNDIGVVGIREKPTLNVYHVGKGLADDGSGFSSNVMAAVQGCVDNGATVISLSLGGVEFSKIEENFYDDIYNQGVLVVAAAGNSGNSGALYPGAYPSVIAVSAVDENGIRPDFSQCNDQVEIVAPGVDIMSTFPPNTYAVLSGTSMAGPHVAGIATQLMGFFPKCTNYQIRNAMVRSTKRVGEYPGYCNAGYGSGLVQGKAAYDMITEQGCEGAGGPVVNNPAKNAAKGGCEQNSDYVANGNTTYRNVCPGAVLKGQSSGSVAFPGSIGSILLLLVGSMVVVSTTLSLLL